MATRNIILTQGDAELFRHHNESYCFDAATATGAPLVANRRTISYGRPPAVAHGPSVILF